MKRMAQSSSRTISVFVFLLMAFFYVSATQYHVATNGLDSNPGTSGSPFKTISHAASIMQPGDTCTVHAGTYREWVKPPRSGTSNTQRIVYRAAQGEVVKIKGSEQIINWVSQGGNVWKIDLQDAFFNGYNPYAKTINWDDARDSYLAAGGWHHRGDVYLNETALFEKQTLGEVQSTANTWYCTVSGTTTSIYANFGSTNPNTALAEINVRHSVIWPDVLGIGYITIDGFTIMHSAEEWSGASGGNGVPQWGAVGPRWGLAWIIQNCRVKNARVIGICIGNEHGSDGTFAAFGHHIVRNNWISHCGQAGIAGERGCAASTIDGNLIEDINDRQEFGGWEGSGIKLHFVVDVTISNNCIRRVKATSGMAGHAMWLDWTCQNSRVTGNVFYSIQNPILNLEVFHGPVIFDNNVFIGDMGNGLEAWSSNVCYVNNLLYNCRLNAGSASGRTSPVFTPHSLIRGASTVPGCRGWRVYNNIIISGANGMYNSTDAFSDYNAYLQGATKAGDPNGVQDSYNTGFAKQESNGQLTATFSLNSTPLSLSCPQVTSSFLGTFAEANVAFTNPDNSSLTINKDYYGNAIPASNVKPGPFQSIAQGTNTYVLWPKNGGATGIKGDISFPKSKSAMSIMVDNGSISRLRVMQISDLRGRIIYQQNTSGLIDQKSQQVKSGTYIALTGKNGKSADRAILCVTR